MTWNQSAEMNRIAEGQYDPFLHLSTTILLGKLPRPRPEREDVFQELIRHTLEATGMYVPDNPTKASFWTFLNTHIQLRCYQWLNWAWQRKQHPKGAYLVNLGLPDDADLEWEDSLTPVARPRSSNAVDLEMKEFIEGLSDESKFIFEHLVQQSCYGWMEDMFSIWKKKRYTENMQRLTGISRDSMCEFVEEVRTKAPKYIGSIAHVRTSS